MYEDYKKDPGRERITLNPNDNKTYGTGILTSLPGTSRDQSNSSEESENRPTPSPSPSQSSSDSNNEFGSGYHRFTTMWQGIDKSLDIINDGDNDKIHLAGTGNYSGQFWKITPAGNGYYRLSSMWQGEGKPLSYSNGKLHLGTAMDSDHQYWKITKNRNGYYKLSNKNKGDDYSMDVINDGKNTRLHMAGDGNYSGQYWKIVSES